MALMPESTSSGGCAGSTSGLASSAASETRPKCQAMSGSVTTCAARV